MDKNKIASMYDRFCEKNSIGEYEKLHHDMDEYELYGSYNNWIDERAIDMFFWNCIDIAEFLRMKNTLRDEWEMEVSEYYSFFQWLPNEVAEDIIDLFHVKELKWNSTLPTSITTPTSSTVTAE